MKSLSHVRLFATPWTVVYQAPPSMGFSRQEYWSRLPFPSPGDLPDPGIEPGSSAFQADALTSEPPGKPFHGKARFRSCDYSEAEDRGKGRGSQQSSVARVQPRWIQGIQRVDGVGEERLVYLLI